MPTSPPPTLFPSCVPKLRDRALARAALAALACAASAACTKAPDAPSVTAPTPATHTQFFIATGVHAVACDSCHLTASMSFKDYTCTACHAHEQSATNGVHAALTAAQGAYTYASKACSTCHLADATLAGYLKAGTKGPYSHAGVSNGCTLCHAVDAPFAALPSAASTFDHTSIGATDCSSCHLLPAGRAPATADWKGGVSLPAGALFDKQASVAVSVQTPVWSGTSISQLIASSQSLPMPMVHCTPGGATRCDSGLDNAALSRCADCHINMASGGFYPGTYHATVAQQPTACNGCHTAAPAGVSAGVTSMPTGFVGPAGAQPRNPPSGEMRHDAVAWDKEVRKSGVPLVTQDCSACHVTPAPGATKQWAVGAGRTGPAKFHASLGTAQPASCNDCHANNRPGQLTQANATGLPPGMTYDHNIAPSQSDCVACHKGKAAFTSWGDGLYHHLGDASPATCLPCHSGARPTAAVNPVSSWKSNTYTQSPFDYQTNAQGIGHGNGNDCVLCHLGPGSGAWDGTQTWQKGAFSHAAATDAGSTCVACHDTQRPATVISYTDAQGKAATFDHSVNGTGDCFGCHQATVAATRFVALTDWKGGQSYPGGTPVGAADQFTSTTSFTLLHTSLSLPTLITGVSSATSTLYNQFVHTAASVPVQFGLSAQPDETKCWHCHTHDNAGTVTSFSGGRYHDSLDNYRATPTGVIAAITQPLTGCTQCHTQRPPNIVEKPAGLPLVPSPLQPMDHAALFTAAVQIGGVTATGAASLDCAACHAHPGSTWTDGVFHKVLAAAAPAATPKDCTACHYQLMADSKSADKASGADFDMQHASPQITSQACDKCHTGALAKAAQTPAAATLWSGGLYHPGVAAQPASCNDCHTVSVPKASTQSTVTYTMPLGGTASNRGQWVSHAAPSVAGKDCQQCHAADAKTANSAWSKGDTFHDKVQPSTCQACHGLGNGSTTAGTNNNLPSGLTNSSKVSSAGNNPATGVPAGTFDQLLHTDVNVASRDCNFCHTVSGPSTVAGVQGKEWAQAAFHANFGGSATLVIDGVTGRCSSCHMNLNPTAAFKGYDHSKLSAQPGTQDCVACHQPGDTWVGTAVPVTPVNDGAHDLALTSLVPSWSGTSIATVSPLPQTLPMPMLHTSTSIAETTSACTNCHSNPSTGFSGGLLHGSLAALKVAQPTACLDCHQTSAPVGFVGPVAVSPARTPSSGEMRHEAVAWISDARTGPALVTQDCAVCHVAPVTAITSPWSAGTAQPAATYHASLTKAGLAQPGSCLDCHANTRPALLSAPSAALPAGLSYDHRIAPAQSDCLTCHNGTGSVTSWTGGRYHLAGSAVPSTCLPCHTGERPSAAINPTSSWKSNTYTAAPFDYLTNPQGISHGNGNDCAACHKGPGTGAWGSTQNWQQGVFTHSPASDAGSTCIACHVSQRPAAPVPYTNASGQPDTFDHSANGTGECFGCHQATITAGKFAALTDWKGGQGYPGASLVGSPSQFISLTELVLQRTAPANPALITGVATLPATIANQFLHTSPAVPSQFGLSASPDTTKCWHCHTSDGAGHVTSFANGQYHPSLDNFTATPGGTKTPLSQATNRCDDCHTVAPANIVEKVVSANGTSTLSDLQPMDHGALFAAPAVIGGVSATGVPSVDCSTCHVSPGATWADGLFHKNIAAAVPKDCTQCHYTLMADAAAADKTSATDFVMKHASGQVTFQACQTCHATALSRGATTPLAATLWSGGLFHPSLASQPKACNDCHTITLPAAATQSSLSYTLPLGGTTSNAAQWMSHKSPTVTGKDCYLCHAADAAVSGSAWSKADSFHAAVPAAATCQECHGVTNGNGAVPGTKNNLPVGLTDSTTVSTAGADTTTGVPAGTKDQISHADLNVTGHDCLFCHTQAGASTTAGIQGKEWAQAQFHASFTGANTPVYNGTTGRCSDCHINVKPTAAYTAFDHSSITATGAQDCASCHQASPPARNDWLGAVGTPQYLTVGGFLIPQPPAANTTTTQTGLSLLPHPSQTTCTSCHATNAGGKNAKGYDHASTVINNKTSGCNSCHELGSDLIGTPWNMNTSNVLANGAGDTRPITLTSFTAYKGGSGGDSCKITATDTTNFPGALNHYYPIDCYQCHKTPTGIAVVTTGSAYMTNSGGGAWLFAHVEGNMNKPTTCNACHTSRSCPE